jgi:hypothetical protein
VMASPSSKIVPKTPHNVDVDERKGLIRILITNQN